MELKTYICIKEVDKKHQLKEDYVNVNPDMKSLKIHDPYNGNAGFQRIPIQKQDAEFNFRCDKVIQSVNPVSNNNIINPLQLQSILYQHTCDEIVKNVTNNIKNGMIVQYGQSKTSKSSILFGAEQQQGILQLTINKILQQKKVQVFLSIFDINLETVRDFGLYFFNQANNSWYDDYDFSKINQNSLEKQSPELLDNSNEIIQVRGLSKIEITQSNQFIKLLQDEETFRQNLDQRHKINSKRYNQIYVLTLKHKGQTQQSYLYFVKLTGSEKIIKEEQQQEQTRIQEQIITNNQLFSLAKYIGGLSKKEQGLSYHDSKLTKALHGILLNEEKPTQVSFISHLYPVEQNYEESLLTLQYLDRLKAYDVTYKKVIFDGPMPEQVQAQERLMQRLIDENSDIRKRYELLQQEEKDKFEEVKKKLGLEFSVNAILKAKPNSKEFAYILLHQEAEERSHTLSNIHQELSKKYKNHQIKQEQSAMSIQNHQKKCDQQIQILEDRYNDLQNKYNEVKIKIKNKVNVEQKEIGQELNKMISHGRILIEEKANLIHGINNEIKKTSEHSNKMFEMKEMGKKEVEFQYKLTYNEKYQQFKSELNNLKEQYEHLLKEKENQLNQFELEANQYTSVKKDILRNARREAIELFQIIRTQYQTIELIEEGIFSGGIKSYNIPKNEKCQLPDRENYKFLFKSLEKNGTLISANASKSNMQYTKQKQLQNEREAINFEDTYTFEMQEKENQKKPRQQSQLKPSYNQYDEMSSSQSLIEFEPFRKVREEDLTIMSLDQLKQLTKAFQQEVKRCQNTQPLNPIGFKGDTIENLIIERNKFKQLLVSEQKRYNDSIEVLESQKRIIEKFSKINSSKAQNTDIVSKIKKETHQSSSMSSSLPTLKGYRAGTQQSQRK